MKKTGQRKRKVSGMATAAGEKEQKEEKKEDEKKGAEEELQQQLPINAGTEGTNEGKAEVGEETDGAETTEEAKKEMGSAPGEMVEDGTEGREDVCKKGNSESADVGLVVEQLKKMLRDSGQMPTDNAPLPVPR